MPIYKKRDSYSKIEKHPDNRIARYLSHQLIGVASNENDILETYSCLNELLADGWQLVPPMLETMTGGETIKSANSFFKRALTRLGGVGELSVYVMSQYSSNIDGDSLKKAGECFTAYELADAGWTIVQPNTPQVKEMTKEDAEKKLSKVMGETIKIMTEVYDGK
jgi:hypothetical protein